MEGSERYIQGGRKGKAIGDVVSEVCKEVEVGGEAD